MTEHYLLLRLLHVLSAMVLVGTGAGIAFFMWRAWRSDDAAATVAISRQVVLADKVFSAPAVVIQLGTGLLLVLATGRSFAEPWIAASLVLFLLTGACWIPATWLQARARDLAERAAREDRPLPGRYHRHMRIWAALAGPAFVMVAIILWLMVYRPAWSWPSPQPLPGEGGPDGPVPAHRAGRGAGERSPLPRGRVRGDVAPLARPVPVWHDGHSPHRSFRTGPWQRYTTTPTPADSRRPCAKPASRPRWRATRARR